MTFAVSSWDPSVAAVIPMGPAPFYPDGIAVSCAPVSSVALRSCVSAMPDHLIHVIPFDFCSPPPESRQGPSSTASFTRPSLGMNANQNARYQPQK